jgi:hypothetical protein
MTVDFATAASQNASSVPDPWHFGGIHESASALFDSDLQDVIKKIIIFAYHFLR